MQSETDLYNEKLNNAQKFISNGDLYSACLIYDEILYKKHDMLSDDNLGTLRNYHIANKNNAELVILGKIFLDQRNNPDLAMKCFEPALKGKLQEKKEAQIGISKCLMKMGKWKEAIEILKMMLETKMKKPEKIICLEMIAEIYTRHYIDIPSAEFYIESILKEDQRNAVALGLQTKLFRKKRTDKDYYNELLSMWNRQFENVELVKLIAEYYKDLGKKNVIFRIDEMLSILDKSFEKKRIDIDFYSNLDNLSLDDYIHEEDKRLKHLIDDMKELKIKEIQGDDNEKTEFQEIMKQSRELEVKDKYSLPTPIYDSLNFFKNFDIKIYEYSGTGSLKVATYSGLEKKCFRDYLVYNPKTMSSLSMGVQTFIIGNSLAELKMNHKFYKKYLSGSFCFALNIIEKAVEKARTIIPNPAVECLGKSLGSALINVIKTKKITNLSKKNIRIIISNLPFPLETKNAIYSYIDPLMMEDQQYEHLINALTYTADRIAYGITKSLYDSTIGILYTSADSGKVLSIIENGLTHIMGNEKFSEKTRNRISQLWQFAFEVEANK